MQNVIPRTLYENRASLRMHYRLKGAPQDLIVTNCGELSPLETSLLHSLENGDAVTHHHQRLFLSTPFFSQIVRNLPQGSTTADRLRDMLLSILDSAGARVHCLLRAQELTTTIMDINALKRDTHIAQRARLSAMEDELHALSEKAQSGEMNVAQFTQHCLQVAQSAVTSCDPSQALSVLTKRLSPLQ